MPLISVIVPVYNAVKYIGDTLESLLQQTFSEFELIIVNDGATDGSDEICKEYADKDKRIKLYTKENGGICSARNFGLKYATGKYIAFCDHDDIYAPNYLMDAYTILESSDSDLLKFEYHTLGITENGQIFLNEIQPFENREYKLADLVKNYDRFNQCIRVLWNGLYRSDIIHKNNILFDERYKLGMEDYAFNLNYLRNCKTIKTIHTCLYTHYMRRRQSAFTKFGKSKLHDIIRVGREEIALISKCESLADNKLIQGMHNSLYISIFLEQITMEDSPLTLRQKKRALGMLRKSGALYSQNCSSIVYVYRHNWKYGVKLNLFSWKLDGLLVCYQELNDRRKGK